MGGPGGYPQGGYAGGMGGGFPGGGFPGAYGGGGTSIASIQVNDADDVMRYGSSVWRWIWWIPTTK